MPNYSLAEIYFIVAMMILITVGSILAVFFFFRTYKREMAQNRIEKEKRLKEKQEKEQEKEQAKESAKEPAKEQKSAANN